MGPVRCVVAAVGWRTPLGSLTATVTYETELLEPRPIHVARTPGDRVFRHLAAAAGITTFVLLTLIGVFLLVRAMPALKGSGLSFFTEFAWKDDPSAPVFGI